MFPPPPYHAGSVILENPQPHAEMLPEELAAWKTRIAGYWPRPNAKAAMIALVISNLYRAGHALYPSMLLIAQRARCCVRTVQRWLKRFEDTGFLRILRRRTNDEKQTSNVYTITIPY